MKTELPKALHPVGSVTMLDSIVASLKKAGITDIITVVGYKASIVEEAFRHDMRFVRQPELLGSGDALAHAVDYMHKKTGTVLVTYGDTPLITDETYRKMVEKHSKAKASCTLLTCRMEDTPPYGRIIRDKKGNIKRIVEEKDATNLEKKIKEVNIGTYCFRMTELDKYIRNIELNKKKKEFYLTDIVDILTKKGGKVISQECSYDEAIGVNSRKDLALANKIANKRTIERLMTSGVTVIDPDTTYIADAANVGKDTIIYPCTVIESNVTIGKSCKIGPFAHLRPGTKLSDNVEVGNYVELCRSTVGKGTRIKHHTYLGDAEVGRDVNVGAGTITANYDGKKKHRTVIEDGAFIGVGVTLIAPVKIGSKAKVGAGSVVTKNKDVSPGDTVVGIPAKPLRSKKRG